MSNPIVVVNVSVQGAPAPNLLQKTGAFVSMGGTSTANNTLSLLTQLSDLTPLLAGAIAITSATWASGVVTVTTAAPHGFPIGTIEVTLAGFMPVAYNGTFLGTVTSTTVFTYPLATNPGSTTVVGTVTEEDVAELVAMATTYFAQGSANSVYVLELGPGSATAAVAALAAWMTANPLTIYSYLVPRYWAATSTFWALCLEYNSLTSLVKFFVTVTQGNYTNFTALMNEVMLLIEAPGIPATEFSMAAVFWATLNYAPGPGVLVPPIAFTELYGVTPYPLAGNAALLQTLKNANVNYVGTGAEGGLSTAILFYGNMQGGLPFNYGYAIDWANIQSNLALSNAVIIGSNSTQNPLYFNQPGVNTLQAVEQNLLQAGVTYGLFSGNVVVNAIPFQTYMNEYPESYDSGIYSGLSATLTPLRGFTEIVFNLNVTDFITG